MPGTSHTVPVWIAGGFDGVSDPFLVTDAFVACVRAVLGKGGKVALWDHPTLTPLALYLEREMGASQSVVIYGTSPVIDRARYPDAASPRRSDSLEHALVLAQPALVLLAGGGEVVRRTHAAALAGSSAIVPLAATEGDTAHLPCRGRTDAERDGLAKIARRDSFPFVADQCLRLLGLQRTAEDRNSLAAERSLS